GESSTAGDAALSAAQCRGGDREALRSDDSGRPVARDLAAQASVTSGYWVRSASSAASMQSHSVRTIGTSADDSASVAASSTETAWFDRRINPMEQLLPAIWCASA